MSSTDALVHQQVAHAASTDDFIEMSHLAYDRHRLGACHTAGHAFMSLLTLSACVRSLADVRVCLCG